MNKITPKPPFIQAICGHKWSPNHFADKETKKRYIACLKCGKRKYL